MVAVMIAWMKEKPFRRLKDTDIIAALKVRPLTFYHYYKDRNELLELLEKQLLIDLKEALRKDFETLTSLEHIPDAQDICRLADQAFQHVFAYCELNQEVGQVLLSDKVDIKFAR